MPRPLCTDTPARRAAAATLAAALAAPALVGLTATPAFAAAPVAVADDYAVAEDSTGNALHVLDNDGDPDGGGVALGDALHSSPSHGTLTRSGDTFVYTPDPDFSGTDSFTYAITDDAAETSDPVTVSITVTPEPDAPVFTGAATNTVQDLPLGGSVAALEATDVDGGSLTFGHVGGVLPHGVGWSLDGTFVGTADEAGTYTSLFSVRDDAGLSTTTTLEITVGLPGARPVAAPDSAEVTSGGWTSVDVVANDTDADGDALEVVALTQPAGGAGHVAPSLVGAHEVVFEAAPTFSGSTSFTYTVSDGTRTDTETVTVTVTPDAVDDQVTVVNGGTVTVDVLANDLGDRSGAVVSHASAERGTVEVVDQEVVYTAPGAGYYGPDTVAYTYRDRHGRQATADLHVVVEAPAPVAVTDEVTVTTGESVTVDPTANDEHVVGPAVVVDGPRHGTVETVDGSLVYTPADGFAGFDSFLYGVAGLTGGSATGQVQVDVLGVAVADEVGTASATPVVVDVLANDRGSLDPTTLRVAPTGEVVTRDIGLHPAGHGTVEVVDGKVRYTPAVAWSGTDTFQYAVAPVDGGSPVVGTVTVTVAAAPVSVVVPAPSVEPPAPAPAPVAPKPSIVVPAQSRELSPGEKAGVSGTAPAGSTVRLFAMTAPSRVYVEVRKTVVGDSGTFAWTVHPNRNTKLYTEVAGAKSPVVVVDVAQTVTVKIAHTGKQSERFTGRAYPASAGQLLSIYRVGTASKPVLVGRTRTRADGTFAYDRTFTGTGTFDFFVQASGTPLNDEGVSRKVTRTIR